MSICAECVSFSRPIAVSKSIDLKSPDLRETASASSTLAKMRDRCLVDEISFSRQRRSVPSLGCGQVSSVVQALYAHGLRTWLRSQQLPQHVLQDAAVSVVERFLRSINAHDCRKLCRLAIGGGPNFHLAACGEMLDHVADAADLQHLFSGQLERVRILSRQKLQRQYSHADQIRTVNALVTFGNCRAHSEKARALCCPIPGRA